MQQSRANTMLDSQSSVKPVWHDHKVPPKLPFFSWFGFHFV